VVRLEMGREEALRRILRMYIVLLDSDSGGASA
jgi:hypothetical protein